MLYNNLAGLLPTKVHPESTWSPEIHPESAGVQVNYVEHCKVLNFPKKEIFLPNNRELLLDLDSLCHLMAS